MKTNPTPPRWATRLLLSITASHLKAEIQGDLEELFHKRGKETGYAKARLFYLLDILLLIHPRLWRPHYSEIQNYQHYSHPFPLSPTMIRNYFKIAVRHLIKNKTYSFINIFGLATGMCVAILIGLWLYDELFFDSYHNNQEKIAIVMKTQTLDGELSTSDGQALQLGPVLRNTYGNSDNGGTLKYVVMSSGIRWPSLSFGDKMLIKSGAFMEDEAPDMLTLKMLSGTRMGLKDQNSILLSESVADALFGNINPIGKILKIDNKMAVKITGVYEDIPENSSFNRLTFIAPWPLLVKANEYDKKLTWGNTWFTTYVQVSDKADMAQVSTAIKYVRRDNIGKDEGTRFKPELFLHPMKRWHLYGEFKNGVNIGGRIQYVWMFGLIGLFVLLLACINFMNLSTARSEKRAKEVGIRKAVGSVRSQLISQFLSESLLVSLLAFVVSLLLAQLALPFFNLVSGKQMMILWTNYWFWLIGIGFSLVTGLLAGSYPALYLSSFAPVKVLKGTFRVGKLASLPRKILVVTQFTVSITLIIGTIIVFRQIQHSKNRPLGYSRNGLLSIPMKTEEVRKGYEAFRNEVLVSRTAIELSQSDSQVTNAGITNSGFEWKGKVESMPDEQVTLAVNHEFGKTVDWEIKEGRDFSRAYATDSSGFILNEAAVKYMGFQHPIGEEIKAFGQKYKVIGVVKNMVMQSPYAAVRPTIFYIDTFKRVFYINVKLNPQTSASEALVTIESIFKKQNPSTPFEYKFADDEYDAKFRTEERIGKLAGFFAILAIFISCLGLFGLASFVAEQRTKEIGVRKVLGASVSSLWALLSQDFVILVIVSFVLSAPIAYFSMNEWLKQYLYRAELSWWIFVLTGIGALLITLLTVSFKAIRSAQVNPLKSLRAE